MYNVAVQSALRDIDTRFNDSIDHIQVHPNIVRKGSKKIGINET